MVAIKRYSRICPSKVLWVNRFANGPASDAVILKDERSDCFKDWLMVSDEILPYPRKGATSNHYNHLGPRWFETTTKPVLSYCDRPG